MPELTHFDAQGHAHMVDVSDKDVTARLAVAEGHVRMLPETLALIVEGRAKKGDVLGVAADLDAGVVSVAKNGVFTSGFPRRLLRFLFMRTTWKYQKRHEGTL